MTLALSAEQRAGGGGDHTGERHLSVVSGYAGAASCGSARSALVRDYAAAVEQGQEMRGLLVLAHRRRDVAELNAEVRTRLKAQGHLGEEKHCICSTTGRG